jgi:hypothetical protein
MIRLEDSDVAADRNSVRCSGPAVISHVHVERDAAPVLQMTVATELGGVAVNGENPNLPSSSADIASGIAKGKITEHAAVAGLGRTKIEANFAPLVVESAVATDWSQG